MEKFNKYFEIFMIVMRPIFFVVEWLAIILLLVVCSVINGGISNKRGRGWKGKW